MAQQTCVGVFEDRSEAQKVAQELIARGVDRNNIQISDQQAASAVTGTSHQPEGFWASLKDAFGFGDDDDSYGYREATRRGGTIVAATAEDRLAEEVCAIMQSHRPIDLDARMAEWSASQQTTGSTTASTAAASPAPAANTAHAATAGTASRVEQGAEAIPVLEEELKIGKRAVNRGGVRVVSRVTERPVEEQINLREEHVHVERRPVDRPLTDADAATAFRERTIEATETAEEAIVAKDVRVVEEVVVSKEAGQRTETVRDSLRRTDVDVQQLSATDEERFRPAYTFADEIVADTRYHGRSFDEIETDLRTSYETRNPNSRWDDVRDAVRTRYSRGRTNA